MGSVIALIATAMSAAIMPVSTPTEQTGVAHAASTICVSVARRWSGSLAETKAIRSDAVPESFRGPYESSGCEHMQLDASSLVSWHLAFGDEDSTASALAYLSRESLRGEPTPEDFSATLATVWQAARQDQASSKATAHLMRLVGAQTQYIFLATEYLRAGEAWRSQQMIDQAEYFLRSAAFGNTVIFPNRRASLSDGLVVNPRLTIEDYSVNRVNNLQLRLAVERARLRAAPENLERANDLLVQSMDPAVREGGPALISFGGAICETENVSVPIKEACDKENDFIGRMRSVWLSAALYELSAAAALPERSGTPSSAVQIAEAALRLTGPTGDQAVFYDGPGFDQKVELDLACVDALERRALAVRGSWLDYDLRGRALSRLNLAERITPAALNPNRFRRIAETYLRIFSAAPRQPSFSDSLMRQAVFMRDTLKNLGQISDGQGAAVSAIGAALSPIQTNGAASAATIQP